MVATPSRTDGGYDISAVERVVQDVDDSEFDLTGKVVVIGCTTNPGDCQRIQDHLRHKGVSVLYNPEFIAQGSILRDLQNADIVLIGGEDPKVIESYGKIYQGIQQNPKIHGMSLTAAEVVKIATNCFLTTKISYANMVGEVLTRAGLQQDIDAALMAIGSDRRIGHNYLRYGFGYGGPCLPRDNRAFAHYATSLGLDFPLGHIVDEFNHRHTVFLAEYFESINVQRLPFYMRHLSYKPNTDIYEESQQLRLAEVLLAKGHDVIVEPTDLMPQQLIQRLKKQYTNLHYRPILDQDHYIEIPT
jgi:nucleotide sugar dehydrogenase